MNNFITSFIITFIAGISTILGGIIVFFNINNKDNIFTFENNMLLWKRKI